LFNARRLYIFSRRERLMAGLSRRALTNLPIALILVVELYPLFWILTSSFENQDVEVTDCPLKAS
jgi:ABC-type glycerol-3-phosphate transport system permease component